LADLEEEHGTPRRALRSGAEWWPHHEPGQHTSRPCAAEQIPDGFEFDEASGFFYNRASQCYLEVAPTRSLFCCARTGVWSYWDALAMEYRPYPKQLLTTRERDLSALAWRPTIPAAPTPPSALPVAAPATPQPSPAAAPSAMSLPNALPDLSRRWGRAAFTRVEAFSPSFHPTTPRLLCRRISVTFSSTPSGQRKHGKNAASHSAAGGTSNTAPSSAVVTEGGECDAVLGVEATKEPEVDWARLVCTVCHRQFSWREGLQKHLSYSLLHRENLAALGKAAT
jgi:hypothetical protein